jgi:hypothetical protein
MDLSDTNQAWNAIPLEEQKQLLAFYSTSKEKPWKNKGPILELPKEIVKEIGLFLKNDPKSYHAFKGTCRWVGSALPTFGEVVDKKNITPFVHRLINRVRKNGLKLSIMFRRTFDEKCRYIDIGTDTSHVARIDKFTGQILNWQQSGMPRGYITDEKPEKYFNQHGLLSVKNLEKIDPKYKERRKEMEKELKEATDNLKAEQSGTKRKMYALKWDESQARRVRFTDP